MILDARTVSLARKGCGVASRGVASIPVSPTFPNARHLSPFLPHFPPFAPIRGQKGAIFPDLAKGIFAPMGAQGVRKLPGDNLQGITIDIAMGDMVEWGRKSGLPGMV